jgi:hypothetical protein
MVKSWWICKCFVGLMLKSWWICSCGTDLVGLMAWQMGGWGVGFGCCRVELWMGCGFCGFDGFVDGWMVKSWWMLCCNQMKKINK